MEVAKNCYTFEDEAAITKLTPIHASVQDLKNGSWFTSKNSGQPGTISNVKMSKTGKHGHAKFTYQVAYPFTGQSSQEMFPGHTHLTRPIMNKYELFVSDYDPYLENAGGIDDNDDNIDVAVACLNEKNEEVVVGMHPKWREDAKASEQLTGPKFLEDWKIASDYDQGKEMVLSIVEGPIKKGEAATMCRMIEKWALKDAEN